VFNEAKKFVFYEITKQYSYILLCETPVVLCVLEVCEIVKDLPRVAGSVVRCLLAPEANNSHGGPFGGSCVGGSTA